MQSCGINLIKTINISVICPLDFCALPFYPPYLKKKSPLQS